MNDDHRRALSRAHMSRRSPALRAAYRAGYASMGELAVAMGVSKAFLSRALARKRPMPLERARDLQRLTGYRWPGVIDLR